METTKSTEEEKQLQDLLMNEDNTITIDEALSNAKKNGKSN